MLRLDKVDLRQGAFHLSLSLEVPVGQRLAIMGASGSGKSTLLSVIAGFTPVDTGRIEIAGSDVTDLPVARRPLSILFQDGNLFPHLSVFDNVALALSPRLSLAPDQRARVDDGLAQVGLEGLGKRKPGALSGGQQSRVALARMLIQNKPLALFDEPFAALDPGLRRDMLGLIDQLCLKTGMTLLMVTHDLRDAMRLCDRVVLLQDGHIATDSAVSALTHSVPAPLKPWA